MLYILIVFLVFLDLVTKFIAKNYLLAQKSLVGDFLYLKYVENAGIAFSIPLTGTTLKILTIIIIGIIFWHYLWEDKKKNSFFINLSYALVIAGAIGNGYERIFNSKVTDFIGVKNFSIFNLADVFVVLGVILYVVFSFIANNKKKNE